MKLFEGNEIVIPIQACFSKATLELIEAIYQAASKKKHRFSAVIGGNISILNIFLRSARH